MNTFEGWIIIIYSLQSIFDSTDIKNMEKRDN